MKPSNDMSMKKIDDGSHLVSFTTFMGVEGHGYILTAVGYYGLRF
jgi:hypothetical protein